MKKIYLSLLLLFSAGMVFGQQGSAHFAGKQENMRASFKTFKHEKEIAAFNTPMDRYAVKDDNFRVVRPRTGTEVFVGKTQYDLQSNSSMQNRILNHGDGTLSAAWTQSINGAGGYPDRGSGYNFFDGSAWGPEPTARVEQAGRTGWPSLNRLGDGSDIMIAHFSPPPASGYDCNVMKQSGDNWLEANLGNMTGAAIGVLWPRSTTGGPDGNTVHAIALTTPSGLGGAVYEGMDGKVLYYRSLDGGNTWDKIDTEIPGVTSANYLGLGGDNYAIHANGETVAILILDAWGDVKVLKSTDNGENWEEHIIYDFPLPEPFDEAVGYTIDDIPLDTLTADGIGVRSNDGAGSVLVDDNGNVHVVYSEIWVSDDTPGDGTWSFFPGINSINYWNESMGNGNYIEGVGVDDFNGNGTFDVADIINEIGSYGQGLATYPSMGVDSDGNVYVVYSAVHEEFLNENANPGLQHFRHLYVTQISDNGMTWTQPLDIISEDYVADPFFVSFIEGVFPSMAKVVDDEVHIVYMQDYEPGHSVSGDMDDVGDNFIVYTPIPVTAMLPPITNTQEVVVPESIGLEIFPNPTNGQATINFELNEATKVSFGLFNLLGQKVSDLGTADFTQGQQVKTIQVGNVAKGTYLVKLQTESIISSKVLVVE